MTTKVDSCSTQARWLSNHPGIVEDAYMILIPYIKVNQRAGELLCMRFWVGYPM